MVDPTRGRRWLAKIDGPREITSAHTGDQGWAYSWAFRRAEDCRLHLYQLAFHYRTRRWRVYIKRPGHNPGEKMRRADFLASFLVSRLTQEEVAAAIAASLIRSDWPP